MKRLVFMMMVLASFGCGDERGAAENSKPLISYDHTVDFKRMEERCIPDGYDWKEGQELFMETIEIPVGETEISFTLDAKVDTLPVHREDLVTILRNDGDGVYFDRGYGALKHTVVELYERISLKETEDRLILLHRNDDQSGRWGLWDDHFDFPHFRRGDEIQPPVDSLYGDGNYVLKISASEPFSLTGYRNFDYIHVLPECL